ncbi:hypothetical protein [Mycobacterium branderi]|uniref:SCP2 domain-containing protein n=1 Tax=Mycobacterium branderi TaxID=43348 RepID=A0A7I7W0L7_9MYCO|nr:hypothetical protein [Mycobacterium branderi]MCV7233670.1 hypothetical protein [Mycobacterium branderi]ORA37917.1 hypothetical protein BST20_12405 [Mycobacterium branderi]BBZ11076.1 hypothetical protein MBRA_12710 [Mycobacterium branderi]
MFFKNADEVDEYICGMFRDAGEHPEVGPKVRAQDLVLRVVLTEPDCELTVAFRPDYQVVFGPSDIEPDVALLMPGDIADKFWRGDYNLARGIIDSEVHAKITRAGPVKTLINKLVPLADPLFPIYRDKIAKKDAAVAGG